jgi:quercetin dioxygenase-like cupin family protein
MKRLLLAAGPMLALYAIGTFAQETRPAASQAAEHGVFSSSDAMAWQDGPASLPPGARFAVLKGDPAKEGLFTMRVRLPAGYRIMPHWHPAVEHITVLSGTFNLGMGDAFDSTGAEKMPAGSFAFLGPRMHHFAWTDEETVIQLHGIGPWQINYLNAGDDPRRTTR